MNDTTFLLDRIKQLTLENETLFRQGEQLQGKINKILDAWNPPMPPALDGETSGQYTDRLTGADKTNRIPYKEKRYRQCSIGYHDECSDRGNGECECPCHSVDSLLRALWKEFRK